MFGSATFDLVIGMVFVFLMLSLVVSALREAIEARLKARAKHLAHGLLELLGNSEPLLKRVYEHPLIFALYDGKYDPSIIHYNGHRFFSWLPALIGSLKGRTNMPSYIPARTFALVLMDLSRNDKLFHSIDEKIDDGKPNSAKKGLGKALCQLLSWLDRRIGCSKTKSENSVEKPQTETTTTTTSTGVSANAAISSTQMDQHLTATEQSLSKASTLIDDIRHVLDSQASKAPVVIAMLAALAPVGNDVEKGLAAIENWYDSSMDRVSGWFKRDSQHILFWLGLAVAVALHVDSIYLTKFLAANTDARAHLVQVATQSEEAKKVSETINQLRMASAASQPQPQGGTPTVEQLREDLAVADVKVSNAIAAVTDLNLPIGWNHNRWNDFKVADTKSLQTILGWIITAFALSFGAPFWFDLFNQLMVIRSTVKPHEKSPEEASQDHQKA